MVQPDLFDNFIVREGKAARASGLFARCLVCQPDSMAGSREIVNFNTIDNRVVRAFSAFIVASLHYLKRQKRGRLRVKNDFV